MDKKKLEAFSREAAKSIKTEKYLCAFSQILTKITIETALNAELDEPLGYATGISLHRRTTAATDTPTNG